MADVIQLGLSDAIAKEAKEHADLVAALPTNEASVVVNQDGVTAIAGVDVASRVTVGGWLTETWKRALNYGAAVRIRFGGTKS